MGLRRIMGQTTFTATAAASGYIKDAGPFGGGKTAFAGGAVQVGRDITGASNIWRGYLSYDTSGGIPNKAVVTKIELILAGRITLVASGANPDDWKTSINMGTFIGAALDTSDWGGSSGEVLLHDWATNPVVGAIDLGSAGVSSYNNTGDTDFELIDNSLFTGGAGDWYHSLTYSGHTIKVYWHLPQVNITGS